MTRSWVDEALVVVAGGLLCGIALAVSRPIGVFVSLAVWLALSLPGFLLLGVRARQGPSAIALASALGVASSLSAIAVVGCLVGGFSLALALGAVAVLSIAATLIRSKRDFPWPTAEPAWGASMLGMIAVLAMIAVPLALVGYPTAGGHAYRPFFHADFFKHMGYTYSVLLGPLPPIDAFSAGGTLHYYWLAYLIPATVVAASRGLMTAQEAVLLTGLWQTAIMALLLFGVALRLTGRPRAAGAAVILGFLGLGPDGPTTLLLRWSGRVPPGSDLNPESVDFFNLLLPFRLDVNGLARLCLYVQQHQLAVVFFLGLAFLVTLPRQPNGRLPLLCKSLLIWPLVGTSLVVGACAAVVILLIEATGVGARRKAWFMLGLAAGSGVLFAALTGMFGGIGPARFFAATEVSSLTTRLAHALCLLPQLFSNFGALGVLGSFGALQLLRERGLPLHARLVVSTGIAVGVTAMFVTRLLPLPRVRFEVDLKASYIVGVCFVLGSSVVLARLRELWPRHRKLLLSCAVLLALGVSSPILDVWWHTDLEGSSTTVVPAGDLQALNWIRANLPTDAVLQGFPYEHFVGHDVWVPIFAGRAVAAAPRGTDGGDGRVRRAAELFDQTDGAELHRRASGLGIEYLYVHRTLGEERSTQLTRVLEGAPDRFARAYANDEAAVWRLLR